MVTEHFSSANLSPQTKPFCFSHTSHASWSQQAASAAGLQWTPSAGQAVLLPCSEAEAAHTSCPPSTALHLTGPQQAGRGTGCSVPGAFHTAPSDVHLHSLGNHSRLQESHEQQTESLFFNPACLQISGLKIWKEWNSYQNNFLQVHRKFHNHEQTSMHLTSIII